MRGFADGFGMPRRPRSPGSPRYKARVGYEGEYYLVQKFVVRGEGFYAVRTPGSGAGKMPKPDVIAVDDGELLAIEVKSSGKPYVTLNPSQVKRLLEFREKFVVKCPHCGAQIKPRPILAVRFLNRGWRFIEIPEGWGGPLTVRYAEASQRPREPVSPSHDSGEGSFRGRRARGGTG